MAADFTSSVGIESNVYPIDETLDVDKNFLSHILDGAALYKLKNDPDAMLLPNQYEFTDRQRHAYNSYAIKCTYTEPDDNPKGLDGAGRAICRCINTFCPSFHRCRHRAPFDYREMAIRFGFKYDEGSIRNVEIFDELLNKLSKDVYLKLANDFKVELKGFKSYDSMLSNHPALFKNKLKLAIKKGVKSVFQAKDEYMKLYEKDEYDFYKAVLIDLFNNYNSKIIEEVLVELGIINPSPVPITAEPQGGSSHVQDEENEKLRSKIKDLEKQISILKDQKEELEKNNKQIVSTNRELKKQNDSWTKKMQELKDDNQNKLVEKDEIIKAIELARDEANNKLINLQEEVKKQNDLIMQRNAVLEIIYGKKRVLLINLKINDRDLIPYECTSINVEQIFSFPESKGQYSEVWISQGSLSDIYIDYGKKTLAEKLGEVTFVDICEKDLKKIGLEVLQ